LKSRNTIPLEQVEESWLRAWVNEGIITAQEFETEMRRRAPAVVSSQSGEVDDVEPPRSASSD